MKIPTQDKIRKMISGIKKFAWIPVQLVDYKWIWFKSYWAFYDGQADQNGDVFLWSSSRPYSENFRNIEDATFYKLKTK